MFKFLYGTILNTGFASLDVTDRFFVFKLNTFYIQMFFIKCIGIKPFSPRFIYVNGFASGGNLPVVI